MVLPKTSSLCPDETLHGSQKKKSLGKTGLIITIEVIPNYELKSLILSFGKEVKVLSPNQLSAEILEMVYGQVVNPSDRKCDGHVNWCFEKETSNNNVDI